jgi:hypothetical protein
VNIQALKCAKACTGIEKYKNSKLLSVLVLQALINQIIFVNYVQTVCHWRAAHLGIVKPH